MIIIADNSKTYYCEKCHRTMNADNFYTSNNLEKYPNEGKLTQCKKCITMHIDNWNPDTYLWILQEIDVPYVPQEWNKLVASYMKGDKKITGMTILGRYLSKMKLIQYKEFRWKDTDFLQEKQQNEIRQAMKRQGYDAAEIAEVIDKSSFSLPDKPLQEPIIENQEFGILGEPLPKQPEENDNDFDLTEEDKLYLKLKWGKTYRPEEWIKLEQLYDEMMQSYDIQSAGHIDTLKLVCKTSLKANQMLDIGDIEGAQKAVKMYDGLMKSGKFTAAQNKAENGEYVDSISELVAVCEKEGFIPRYYVDKPQDKVDRVIQDMQDYTRNLIVEEMHLGPLIERAVKQIEEDREKEALLDDNDSGDEEAFEEALFNSPETFLTDQDFADFNEFEEENFELDQDFYESLKDHGA